MPSKSRHLSRLITGEGDVINTRIDSDAVGTSASKSITATAGTVTYSSADTLPASATNGDQALVTSTNRLYIYTNGGWYNIALINNTPYWSTEANSSYSLAKDSTPTVVTILAVDSDGVNPTYSATTDSAFDAIATISKDSDSGRVFTIVPIDSEGGSQTAGSGTVTFKASDGINLVSTVSTFSISFTVDNSNYTTLLLTIDSTATDNQVDASSNNYTITEAGDVKSTAFTPYHPNGYSTYMSSAGHCLIVPLAAMTGDWTIESWVYHTANSGTASQNRIFGGATNDPLITNTGLTGLDVYINNNLKISTTSSDVNGSKWYHFALVRDDTAGTLKLFVNGVLLATDTEASDTEYDIDAKTSSPYFGVGSDANNTAYGMTGYMKDFRVVNGTAVYSTNFTPPTAPLTAIANTELLLCNQPYHRDMSGNNHTVTFSGTPQPTRNGPYVGAAYDKATHGGSVYFDGSGDYFTVGSASDSGLSGTFTIEFWMYLTAAYNTAPGGFTIASNYDGGATNWTVTQRSGGQMWLSTSVGTPLSYNLNPQTNTWYHIAFSNDSSNSTGKLFVNGIEVDDHTGDLYNSTHMAASAQPITIGRLGNNTQDFPGYISDLRIIDGTMLYTSNFTPPTAPLTAITNTKLLTCTNKSPVWDASGSELTGPVYNNGASIQSGVTHTGFNAGYFLFDGTDDWIQIPYDLHHNANFGTSDFTIEFWLYPHVDELATMIGNDIATPGNWNGWIILRNVSQNTLYLQWNGNGMIETSLATAGAGTYTVNTWHHFAATRQNGTLRTFFNGNLIGSTSFTADMTDTNYLTIGMNNYAGGLQHFDGALKEIRFTKGLARYTSTFTPPTTNFDG